MTLGIVIVLICESLLVLLGFYLIYSWLTKTPFYPSSLKQLNKFMADSGVILPENGKFIDIGSGDGRIVYWAVKRGFFAEGIEFNPFLTLFSRLLLFLRGAGKKSRIHNKDFRNHDYTDYDIAYLYIFPKYMDMLESQLFKQMKKGSIIITNTFPFTNIKPDEVHNNFYIYRVK